MRGFQPAGNKTLKKNSTGPVRGPGTGTSDEVADTVQEGTYIMPTDSTEAIGEQNLAAMGKGAPVDVQLSNGEFKLPPEQVHAIGVQALDQMKDATHTPVAARGFAPGAQQGAEPPLFFSGGGVVDEENAKRFAQVPASIGHQPGRQQPAAPAAPAPQGMTDAQRATAISQIPTGGVTAPKPPAPAAPLDLRASPRGLPAAQAPDGGGFGEAVAGVGRSVGSTLAGAFPGTTMAARGAMDDTRQAYQQSGIGGALGAAARTAMTPVIGLADDVIGSTGRALDPAAQAIKTFVTGDATPIGQQAAAPAAAKPAASQAVAANPNAAAPASGASQIKPGITNNIGAAPEASLPVNTTAAAAATEPSQPSATQIAPGVFRSGNSYSDSAAGAVAGAKTRGLPAPRAAGGVSPVGMSPEQAQRAGLIGERVGYNPSYDQRLTGGAGQPSAQNMAAADALAQRSQQESMSRVMAGQPVERGWSGVIGQVSGNGNMWSRTPEQQQRDAEVSASSIINPPQARGLYAMRRVSDMDRARDSRARDETDLRKTAMQNQGQQDVAAMREAGDTRRNALDNSTRLAEISARGFTEGARNAIDQGRLDLEQKVRGFDIRAGQRQEKLYEKYDAAKTPEEKSAIVQQIRDLSGKQTESPWKIQVTPATKNVDGSTSEGSIYRYNGQTGAVERVDTSKPQLPLDQNPQAAAIKANTALTREQRAAELRKLGY